MAKKAKKLTEEELASLTDIRTRVNTIRAQYGDLCLREEALKAERAQIDTNLNVVKQDEYKVSLGLQEKYGKVNINIDTGEIGE